MKGSIGSGSVSGPRRKTIKKNENIFRRFFRVLGPGLITGAADDDPSGVAMYS
jgi:Mn2+/Fe2+ NRAMP family transporter